MNNPKAGQSTELQEALLWIGATRYYMGRMTYAVSDFCELLIQKWETIDKSTQEIIKRDLTKEIKRHEENPFPEHGFGSLGMSCDYMAWKRVQQLWK